MDGSPDSKRCLSTLLHDGMLSEYIRSVSEGFEVSVCLYDVSGAELATALYNDDKSADVSFCGFNPAMNDHGDGSGVHEFKTNSGALLLSAPVLFRSETYGYAAVIMPAPSVKSGSGVNVLSMITDHILSLAGLGYDVESLSAEVVRGYEELALIYGITAKLGESVEVDDICRVLVDEADKVLDANDILVQLADERTGVFRTVCSSGLHARESSVFTPDLEDGLTGQAYVGHRSVIVCDVNEDKRHTGWPYAIRRFMTVPMMVSQKVIGLITATDRRDGGEFDSRNEKLISAMSSVAAIAVKNAQHYAEIKKLLEGFIDASVIAVESRDPTTSGHSSRVALLTLELARKVDESDIPIFKGVKFSRDDMLELHYACLLHDFGKIGVSESILLKGAKLPPERMETVMHRFAYIKERKHREALERKLDLFNDGGGKAFGDRMAEIDRDLNEDLSEIELYTGLVKSLNNPSVLLSNIPGSEKLSLLRDLHYTDASGEDMPYLTQYEYDNLSIKRGTLNRREREEIEMHVSNSYNFLSKIPWTDGYLRLSGIVRAHHERLNGSGYPDGLSGDDIPLQSKMMAVADIYDALTAWDRPYKDAVSPQKALSILEMEAGEGKLDPHLVQIFRDAGIYKSVESPRHTSKRRSVR